MQQYGISDNVSSLRRVLVRPPSEEAPSDIPWHGLGYESPRDGRRAVEEHEAFVALLREEGVEVHVLPACEPTEIDGCFACDPMISTPWGVIINRMGKESRRGEERVLVDALQELGVPELGRIESPGTVEGGDVLWLGPDKLVVGVGFRTNDAGVEQLRDILGPNGVSIRVVELPWDRGPRHCLHLRSLINPVASDLIIVHRPLLPVGFVHELEESGFQLVDAAPDELDFQGNNLLVIKPGHVVLVGDNLETERVLREAGVTFKTFSGGELCVKGTGGPTCLSFELFRSSEEPAR